VQLEVRVFAGLHRYIQGAGSGQSLNFELKEGTDGYALLNSLNIPLQEAFVFMVNGRREDLAQSLHNGDRIGIFPPVGGG